VAGVALAAGLGLWTFQRIGEAKTTQSAVEARRSADSERAAAIARAPQQIAVVRGRAEHWQARVDLDGTLEAAHRAELGFKVSGRLERIHVEVGDRVRAGATLAQLDAVEAAAQVGAIEAQVRAAEASVALAKDAERRTLPLVQNGSVNEASGVQASSQRELSVAQLDAARAQLALARAGVQNHALSAPFSGTITRAPNGVGAVVSPGQPLFELVDTQSLKLSTTVNEEDADLLAVGAPLEVATGSGNVTGRISAILGTLDARTRRVPVVAEFDNTRAASTLRAGAFVRGWVSAQREIPVLRVPHTVLRPGSQDEVFVVNASSRLESRRIAYSIAPDGTLLVRRGIVAEDQVVVAPIAEAKTGDEVRLEGDAMPAPSGEKLAPAPAVAP
jgi:cobalt-zinc-cadmium efflux system membrane fusion protein